MYREKSNNIKIDIKDNDIDKNVIALLIWINDYKSAKYLYIINNPILICNLR